MTKKKANESSREIGSLNKYGFDQADAVWDVNALCPTILTHLQGQTGHQINILEEEDDDGE